MKKYLLLFALCCFVLAVKAQTTDTVKMPNGPPPPANGLDPDGVNKSADKIFASVNGMPEFPGGADSLRRYLNNHIIYPPKLLKDHVGGQVTVSFVVETDGSLSNLKALHPPRPQFSIEALRAMQGVKYIPGTQNGQVARVRCSITITFDPDYPGFY